MKWLGGRSKAKNAPATIANAQHMVARLRQECGRISVVGMFGSG